MEVQKTAVNNLHVIEEEISIDEVKAALKKIGMSYTELMHIILKKIVEFELKNKRDVKNIVHDYFDKR